MSVRDDYPAVAILHDAWTSRDRTGDTPPQAVQMLDGVAALRRLATSGAHAGCLLVRSGFDTSDQGQVTP